MPEQSVEMRTLKPGDVIVEYKRRSTVERVHRLHEVTPVWDEPHVQIFTTNGDVWTGPETARFTVERSQTHDEPEEGR